MERLNQLHSFYQEKEKKKLEGICREASNGLPEMTLPELRLACMENGGYDAPELNDKLYLHFRGYKSIRNLDAYVNCKSMWLDSNGLERIEGLDALKELRCLFLSKNLISTVEGFLTLKNLTVLDISYNRISLLQGLSCCPLLQSLNVGRNLLSGVKSIEHLTGCLALQTLDITNNCLEGEEILQVFSAIPNMMTLSLNGNELTKIPSFRKKMITLIPRLGYLDRPIEELERLGAVAFITGGSEAEVTARDDYRAQKLAEKKKEMADFRDWQKEQRLKRAADKAAGLIVKLEFTAEETEQRRIDAHRDAMAEKSWVQGLLYGGGVEAAVVGGATSGQEPPAVQTNMERDDEILVASLQDAPSAEDTLPVFPYCAQQQQGGGGALSDLSVFPPPVPTLLDHNEAVAPAASPEARVDKESDKLARKQQMEEENVRALRVQESLAIFKQRGPSSPVDKKTTWESALSAPPPAEAVKSLYWSEIMDAELQKQARLCKFNFSLIAIELATLANDGFLGLLTQLTPERITTEECRKRYAYLDSLSIEIASVPVSAPPLHPAPCSLSEDIAKLQSLD